MPVSVGSSLSCGDETAPSVPAARLRLNAVSLTINKTKVLDRVSIDLSLSGRTVLLGANGSGKSSLLAVMQGLKPATSGEVQTIGTRPGERVFATIFQKPVMLRRSASANIAHALACAGVARADRGARIRGALDSVGLLYAQTRPARALSGGEQQRLAIARARALSPQCLLCDEPTASLDPGAAAEVERLLESVSKAGCGLIVATHDLAQARRIASDVVFIHRGSVRFHGPADQFFIDPADPVARRFIAGDLVGDMP